MNWTTLTAQRRDIWARKVAGRMNAQTAERAQQFDAYARLAQRLPQWLRQNGLRLTLDYLHMLAHAGSQPAAAAAAAGLLDDWAGSNPGQGQLSLAACLAGTGQAPFAPTASQLLQLQQLALADAAAVQHLCTLAQADRAAGLQWSSTAASYPDAGTWLECSTWTQLISPAELQPDDCLHIGLNWRYAGEIPLGQGVDTYRTQKIKQLVAQAGSDKAARHHAAYHLAFQRRQAWLQAQNATHGTLVQPLRLRSHLFTALGERGVWESNALLHPVWGMPYIASSQIKNLVRRVMDARIARMEEARRQPMHDLMNDLLGLSAEDGPGGRLVVHDAWWVPGSADTPVVGDLDNHHGDKPWADPSIHPQLAVRGQLQFALGIQPSAGPHGPAIVQRCMRWLYQALAELGVGGRSFAVGAGRFAPPPSDPAGPPHGH